MIIAVNTNDLSIYHIVLFIKVAKEHLLHNFIFISENPINTSLNFSENIIPVVIKNEETSFLFKAVNNKKISSILKKYKTDVLLSERFLPNTKVPHCLIFNNKSNRKSLQKAKAIITNSQFSKKEIIAKFKIEPDKIDVVYNTANEKFGPVDFLQREKVKEKYAEGNEYFLVTVNFNSHSNLLNLLKAFSVFKKMQKSKMQLIINSPDKISKKFIEDIKLYKYKDEVKVIENISEGELINITASAYAIINLFFIEDVATPLLAMKCNVPLIVSNIGAMPEICNDAALYINPENYNDIAEKIMLIFKDENLRQQLIEKGREQIKKYSVDKVADSIWQCIIKATL
ncbi:MAG: glycosyltransferase family 4 protein [Bacteroidota bacterium]|nr:glycosyltransferase family 4 protein [Bacteroidota bacterium]